MKKLDCIVLFAALALPNALASQDAPPVNEPAMVEVGFDSPRWVFSGGAPRPTVTGKDTAWAISGVALLRDVMLEDGVIELEAYAGFPALIFHAESPDEFETVYFRTPMSGLPDAVQYEPVHRHFLAFRLYGDAQAAAVYDTTGGMLARNRFRVSIQGREVRVFVNGSVKPSLVATLRHPARGGAIGVWGMSILEGMQRFARFRYATGSEARTGTVSPTPVPAVAGAIMQWELSSLLIGHGLDAYPAPDSTREWRPVTADYDGLVNITRYLPAFVAEGKAVPAALRTTIKRNVAGRPRMTFAFCDRATIFLNGRRVFTGILPVLVNGDNPRIAARDTISLDLRAGANELLVVTSGQAFTFGEANGGWGFRARFLPAVR